MAWSFEELISYASRGTWIRPGDVLGSGTCGSGCLLELRGRHGATRYPWLAPGDTVTLHVEGIGDAQQHGRGRGRSGRAAAGTAGTAAQPGGGMRIDCHAHVHPPAYREALGPLPLPPTDARRLLEATMERHGIDAAVISVGPPARFHRRRRRARPTLARRANDGIAEVVRDEPQRGSPG